jgi:hypothetical protein
MTTLLSYNSVRPEEGLSGRSPSKARLEGLA